MKNTLLLIATLLLIGIQTFAQTGVAINTTGAEPDGSAMLDVTSTEKGILIPRMLEADRTAIVSPATGLLVFQTDGIAGFYYYDGTQWRNLSLVNFSESNFTNASKTGVKFTPNHAATDVDFVLQPKGTGSILAQQPDGTTIGGNNRGNRAVDLQMQRDIASHVASGNYAVIGGGRDNYSGNTCSVVGGGESNDATGVGSIVAGGANNYAGGNGSIVGGGNINSATDVFSITGGGEYNTSSADYSIIGGGFLNYSTGNYAIVAGGETNMASGSYAVVGGGINNTAPSYGETVFGYNSTKYTVSTNGATQPNDTDRLFSIGNGATFDSESNALTILKNANTTIGGSLTINGNGTSTGYVFPVSRGTSGQVLQTNGSGVTSWSTPYTGLTNFTESNYTFNARTGVKLLATNAATDVDFVISPKGNGAIIAQQPDGTGMAGGVTGGGNVRGDNAVDLQTGRILNTHVASGDHSVIIGGFGNTASGNTSFAMGIYSIASGSFSAAIGASSTASGDYSTATGSNTLASGSYSTTMGKGTIAPSGYEVALGLYNTDYTPVSTFGWNNNDRLFVLGNGTGNVTRSDAFTILKSGNTTIGGSLTLNGNSTGTSFTFPATRGTSGQLMKTAGDGTTSWSTITKSDLGLGNVENTAISTWAGSSNITTVGTIATGTWNGTTIALNKGGTGATTKSAAFDALSPMTTLGDIVYGGANGTGTRLAKGTAGQVLTMNAGATAPVWSTPASGTVTSVTGSAPIASSGGTTPAISISAATTSAAGSMSAADKTKLDGIAANANNYSHPTGDGNLHVPATSTTNDGKVLIAGATAGSLSWGTITESQNLTNVLTQGENAGDKKMVNIDQVGIGTDSPNAVAALEISSTTQGFLPPRMTHAQIMAITPVEGLVVYNTTVKLLMFYNGTDWIKGDGSPYLYVGKSYQGGIIFYIFQSGDPPYVAGETHGLIASTSDQSSAIRWYNGTAVTTNASSKALGAGLSNTDLIISVQGATSTSYAAGLARAYNGGGYSDWFLPSENEIIKLLSAKDIVGGFEYNRYWTSSESTYFPTTKARLCNFGQYIQGEDSKALTLPVRAIRSF